MAAIRPASQLRWPRGPTASYSSALALAQVPSGQLVPGGSGAIDVLEEQKALGLGHREQVSLRVLKDIPKEIIGLEPPILPALNLGPHPMTVGQAEVGANIPGGVLADADRAREPLTRRRVRSEEPDAIDADGHGHPIAIVLDHHPQAEELPCVVQQRPFRRTGLDHPADPIRAHAPHLHDALVGRAMEHPSIVVELTGADGGGDLGIHRCLVGRRRIRIARTKDHLALKVALELYIHPIGPHGSGPDLHLDRLRDHQPTLGLHLLQGDGDAPGVHLLGGLHQQLQREGEGHDEVEIP